ncbi:MAG: 2-isopropylmalate synthase [Candidatus Hydrogenedentes bacterium]|jgi:2-isopropylmalate synthase|nr:2-isopropylmalate synthase [Candidatus Hydrogenedentota bacterium]
MSNRIYLFDTTLRDGEQSPGASMDVNAKIQMAQQLDRLGVDVLEAGFPIASQDEFDGVVRVAKTVKKSSVAALARALNKDIERAAAALEHARSPVLHTFLATSDIHMEYKLKMSKAQVVDTAVAAVRLAKSLLPRVEFSAEDATRSNPDFLVEVVSAVIEAGADVINLPDTVGYTTPDEIREMFRYVIANAAGADKVIFSSHNHNDLGLAVANALAAIQGGARQIECTVNGIGERAGNTALEELVMAIHTRSDQFPFECGINKKEITSSSTVLSMITGLTIPFNKPIVGRNAFAHESGIHQHGMLAHAKTYEIMTPESVGRERSDLVLGKHSGRAGLAKRSEDLGFDLTEEEIDQLYDLFIDLADKKKEVYTDDLRMLIVGMYDKGLETYYLEQLRASGVDPTVALVKLRHGDQVDTETATGDGPVDAACKAIEKIAGLTGRLEQFEIRATTPGKDALGEAYVMVRFDDRLYRGNGVSTDIVEAAIHAYLNALNKHVAYLESDRVVEAHKNGNGNRNKASKAK